MNPADRLRSDPPFFASSAIDPTPAERLRARPPGADPGGVGPPEFAYTARMPYRNVKPAEAKRLVESEGWTYVDVRSVEEFESGHVPGAFNVPILHRAPTGGMTPNADFVRVVRANFAPDARLVIGCAAGMRSMRACEMLAAEGFTSLANMQGGFLSARDGSGHVLEPGWTAAGYPVESASTPERRYATLNAKR